MNEAMSHDKINALLPWYANGTLADDERKCVKDHVRACLACRLELKKERDLHELVQSSPTVNVTPEDGFERLSRRLDDHARGGRRAPLELFAGAMRFSAAAVVLLAVAGVLLWLTVLQPVALDDSNYMTLTSESESAGTELDIVFAADISEPKLRALVTEIDGSIVSGPTAVGRYRIRLHDGAIDEAHLTDLIRTLSNDERVRFAGPSL